MEYGEIIRGVVEVAGGAGGGEGGRDALAQVRAHCATPPSTTRPTSSIVMLNLFDQNHAPHIPSTCEILRSRLQAADAPNQNCKPDNSYLKT